MLSGFLSFLAVGVFVFLLAAPRVNAAAQKKWTFAVYLDADNNLEDAGIADFLEMAKVGSSADVNVVVQMDRAAGYDTTNGNWTTCKRFYMTKGIKPIAADQLSDIGEVNMGAGKTLTTFINWVKDNYPADHYALVLWNHGGGWRDHSLSRAPLERACCWDDSSPNGDDCLYTKELREAVAASSIPQFDLIGFDACLMGHVEVAYEMKSVIKSDGVMIGSEETEPGDGWTYDKLLSQLNGNSTAEDLGKAIVDTYGAHYGAAAPCTQACSRQSKVQNVADKLNAFADAMNDNSKLTLIQKARKSMRAFAESDGYYGIDLYKFADLVGSSVPDLKSKTDDVRAAIDAAMVDIYAGDTRQGSYSMKGHGGLCVYFPKAKSDYDTAYGTQILYGSESAGRWDDFLKRYYAGDLGNGGSGGGNTVTATASLSRKSVAAGTLYASVTLTLTPTAGNMKQMEVVIPAGWQLPQAGSTKVAGYVKAYIYKTGAKAYPLIVTASGQKVNITVPDGKITGKEQIKMVYYKFTTQKTAGTATFTTSIGSPLIEISKDPSIKVGASKLAIGDDENDVDDEAVTEDGGVKTATLEQNYPNPFNPSTTFSYYLDDGGRVTIKLYNVAGQEVDTAVDEDQVTGEHAVSYNSGAKLARGVYYYRLTLNGKEIGTKRAVVLK